MLKSRKNQSAMKIGQLQLNVIFNQSRRNRRTKLQIIDQKTIQVSYPPNVNQQQLISWLKQQESWITNKLITSKLQSLHTDQSVQILGNHYSKKVVANDGLPLGVFIQGKVLVINFLEAYSLEHRKTKERVNFFLKSTASKYIIPRAFQLAKQHQLTVNRIMIKKLKSRWGSCSSLSNLNFNYLLVHLPISTIDYVICHELAHLVHANHSRQFWQLVVRYYPDYRQQERRLKNTNLLSTYYY